jgi:hypothetical protein
MLVFILRLKKNKGEPDIYMVVILCGKKQPNSHCLHNYFFVIFQHQIFTHLLLRFYGSRMLLLSAGFLFLWNGENGTIG